MNLIACSVGHRRMWDEMNPCNRMTTLATTTTTLATTTTTARTTTTTMLPILASKECEMKWIRAIGRQLKNASQSPLIPSNSRKFWVFLQSSKRKILRNSKTFLRATTCAGFLKIFLRKTKFQGMHFSPHWFPVSWGRVSKYNFWSRCLKLIN